MTLAITAVAPTPEERVKAITITDDEHRNGPTPRTQHYLEKDAASQPSVARGEHPRPPDYLTLSARGNYSPSDGDGKEGGGGGGLRAGRAATPGRDKRTSVVVRGFSRRSNRKLVRNAITFLCLAGGHLKEQKARVLEVNATVVVSNERMLYHELRRFRRSRSELCSDDAANGSISLLHRRTRLARGFGDGLEDMRLGDQCFSREGHRTKPLFS